MPQWWENIVSESRENKSLIYQKLSDSVNTARVSVPLSQFISECRRRGPIKQRVATLDHRQQENQTQPQPPPPPTPPFILQSECKQRYCGPRRGRCVFDEIFGFLPAVGHSSERCLGRSERAVVMTQARQWWRVSFTAPRWFKLGVNVGCDTEMFKPRQSQRKTRRAQLMSSIREMSRIYWRKVNHLHWKTIQTEVKCECNHGLFNWCRDVLRKYH